MSSMFFSDLPVHEEHGKITLCSILVNALLDFPHISVVFFDAELSDFEERVFALLHSNRTLSDFLRLAILRDSRILLNSNFAKIASIMGITVLCGPGDLDQLRHVRSV